MSLSIFLLVLCAALLHATWNLIVKGGGDPLFEAALNALGGGLAALCLLQLAPAPEPAPAPQPDIEATIVDAPAPKAAPAEASEDDVFKTNVMQTRIASAEELDFLRRQDRKTKRGKKLKYILPILGGAIVLGLVFFLKGNPPEEKLTWPLRADGKYSEKAYDPQGGGHAAGRFSLIAPLTELT